MIFTLNEELHLPSCLDSLRWCDDVIVVDSFSVDRTREMCAAAGARFLQRAFDGFGTQRNWALENAKPRHEWILILDADERVPPDMVREMARVLPSAPEEVGAFRVARRFHMWGRWLRYSSLYPTYVVRLVRAGRVSYVNRGHAETQLVSGRVLTLASDLIDENLKGLEEWFARQNRYSSREAEFELSQESEPWRVSGLFSADPLVRRAAYKRLAAALPGRPIWYFIYAYVFRAGFLDGIAGFMFCILRSMYQGMISMKRIELRRSRKVDRA
jgi:glycosyltransferase involved in cell wall biosynthesis